MKSKKKVQSVFLNPNRENKRCFAKYFKAGFNNDLSASKESLINNDSSLQNISKASSMKFRHESLGKHLNDQNQVESQLQRSQFIIMNKRKINDLQNPEIFQLISKHIERTQTIIKRPKKISNKTAQSLLSERVKIRSNSIYELQKIPKITQFSRQTFYQNPSSARNQYYSKKQRQDILHSNINLNINSRKQVICKKTRPYKDGRSFVTYELFNLNKRIGIGVEILAGSFKQIKFRLMMNQTDTNTFHKHWIDKIDQFIDKCLSINQDGISVRLGSFNFESSGKKKINSRMHVQKIYLQNYQALLKRKKNKKMTKQINYINLFQQHQPNQSDKKSQKQITKDDLHIQSNSNKINQKKIQQKEKKAVRFEQQQQVRNNPIVQIDLSSLKQTSNQLNAIGDNNKDHKNDKN